MIDPLAHSKASQEAAIRRPPIIAPGGKYVVVPIPGTRDFYVFRIGKAERKRLRFNSWNGDPLTIAFHARRLGILMSRQDELEFWNMGLFKAQRPPREIFHGEQNRAKWLPSAWVKFPGVEQLYVLDEAGNLVCWAREDKLANDHIYLPTSAGKFYIAASNVLGLAAVGGSGIIYACLKNDNLFVIFNNGIPAQEKQYCVGKVSGAVAVQFAGGNDWARRFCGCAVAFRHCSEETEYWHIYFSHPSDLAPEATSVATHPLVSVAFTLPKMHKVIGLTPDLGGNGYALVALAPNDRGVLLFHHPDDIGEIILTSPTKIRHATVDGSSGLVAVLTEDDDLIVYLPMEKSVRVYQGICNDAGLKKV